MALKESSQVNPYLKLMLFGPSGMGKTTFCAGAQQHPDMSDVLFLPIDSSFDAVAHIPGITQDDDVKTPEQLEAVIWKIAKKDPAYARFKTLIVDNVTALSTFDLEDIAKQAVAKGDTKNHPTQDSRFRQDYGLSNTRCFRILRTALSLPMHVILTAWEKVETNEETGRTETTAMIPGGLRKQLLGYTGQTWAMTTDNNGKRALIVKKYKTFDTKTRQKPFEALLQPAMELPEGEPTLAKLFDLYKQAMKGGAVAAKQSTETSK